MMAYASWSVVFGEQPSAAKWNILGTNDASFNDGTGIGNATIGASKLATGAAAGYVATQESTTSTSYTDLTTPGPSVTVTVGANGLLAVFLGGQLNNNTTNNPANMTFAASGANTIAAADLYSVYILPYTGNAGSKQGEAFLLTGLAAGSTTLTCKYKCGIGGTSLFTYRRIAAIPL